MRVYFDIDQRTAEALQFFTAKRFLQIDDRILMLAARVALIEFLALETDLDADAVRLDALYNYEPMTTTAKATGAPTTVEAKQVVVSPAPTPTTPPAPTSAVEKPMPMTMPKGDLPMPQRVFHNKQSNTWTVWSALIRYCVGGDEIRWPALSMQAVANMTGLTVKQAGQVLYSMTAEEWLRRTKKNSDYTFSDKAREWIINNKRELESIGVFTA